MALLEEACFSFVDQHHHEFLQAQGIDEPEDVELSHWLNKLRQLSFEESALRDVHPTRRELRKQYGIELGANGLGVIIREIADIRHAVVHRQKLPVEGLGCMVYNACRVAWSFRQEEVYAQLKELFDWILSVEDNIGSSRTVPDESLAMVDTLLGSSEHLLHKMHRARNPSYES